MNWKKAALAAGAGAIEVFVIISGFLVVFFAMFDPNSLLLFAPPTPPGFRDFLFVAGYVIAVVLGGTLPGIALGAGFIKSFAASLVAHMGSLALLIISPWATFLILLIPPMVVTLVAVFAEEAISENHRLQKIIVIAVTAILIPLVGAFVFVLPENFSLTIQFAWSVGWIVIPAAGALLSPRTRRGQRGS